MERKGFNAIGGDALSVLLEQKLKELSSRVEFSQKDMLESGSLFSSANNYGNMGTSMNLTTSLPPENDICKSKLEIQKASDCASVEKDNKVLYLFIACPFANLFLCSLTCVTVFLVLVFF